jgi:hypothetical protein
MTSGLCWFIVALVISALPSSSLDKNSSNDDVQAILHLHAQTREAHLKGDAALIAASVHDHFLNVQNGNLESSTREELRQRFSTYLAHVKYSEWNDVIPPSVHVSSDGNMASAAIKIKARFTDLSEPSPRQEHEFISSWIAVYEKQPAGWRMTGISSGCEPACGAARDRRQ